jgi:biotin operon repressor
MSEKPTYQMSVDSRLVYQAMKKVEVGASITHQALQEATSRKLSQIRDSIRTAIRRLRKDDGMVFVSVRGVGYKRCTDEDIVDNSISDTGAVRRKARVAVERLTKVRDYAALPPKKQLEHTTRLSVLGVIASMTREPAMERVRQAANGRASELPIAETLRAFQERA